MRCMFKCYLQIFTAVQCGFLFSRGRCPIRKRFRPKSYESCPHLGSQPLLLSIARSSPKLGGRGGTKILYLTYPHREKSKFIKSGDRGGQAIVPPSLIGIRLRDDWQDF